jgi:putative salt-induced outer membrane protein YdiY
MRQTHDRLEQTRCGRFYLLKVGKPKKPRNDCTAVASIEIEDPDTIEDMTHNLARRGISPAVLALSCVAFALIAPGLPLNARAQTPVITNTIVTTVITTSASATNTTVTTNATTKITLIPPPVAWSTSATFALTVTGGNTKTLLTTVDFNTQRISPENEFLFDVNGTYGENDNVENAQSLEGTGQYNHVTPINLYYGIKLDGLHDAIAGIDYRFTVSPLAGYYLIKTPSTLLGLEIGPGYLYQRNEGSDTTLSHATLRGGERFEHKINGTTKIWQNIEILPQVANFGNYYTDGEIGINTAITKHAGLTCYADDSYYSVPAIGKLHNDFKLVTGITYKF